MTKEKKGDIIKKLSEGSKVRRKAEDLDEGKRRFAEPKVLRKTFLKEIKKVLDKRKTV